MANADRRRVLRAGPLYAEYHRGDLWSARFGDVPALDRLYVRIRDEAWGTVPMRSELTALDRPGPAFRVVSRLCWGEEPWATGTLEVTGSARELLACATITFRRRVCLQRAGLNLHHPLASTVGRDYHWVNGRSSGSGTFPAVIYPQLRDRSRYLPMIGPFGRLTIGTGPNPQLIMDFAGAQFETEDQRNWTDASFKTYGPPVDQQEPRWHEAGSVVRQTVRITARTSEPAARRSSRRGLPGTASPAPAAGATGPAVVRIGAGTEPALPPVGVTASSLWPALDAALGALFAAGPPAAAGQDMAASRVTAASRVIAAGRDIAAGRHVAAGRDVAASRVITAGRDIPAGRDIEAGPDHVRVEVWPESEASAGQLRYTLALLRGRGIPLELALRGGAADPARLGQVLRMAAAVPVRAVLALGSGTEPATPRFTALVRDLARQAGIGAPVAAGAAGHFSEINRCRDAVRHAGPVVWSTSPQVHESDDRTVMQAAPVVGQTAASAARIWPGQGLAVSCIRFTAVSAAAADPVPDPRAARPFAAAWLVAVLAGLTGTRCDWLTVDLPMITVRPDRTGRPAPTQAAGVLRALRQFRGLPLARVQVTDPGLAVLAARPPGGLQLLMANLTRRRSVPVLLPGLARAAGAGASEPCRLNVSSGGQAEIILGPYEVIHLAAVSADAGPRWA